MLSNLKLAVRSLRKSPAFAASVILTFALSIGANTAIFSLFHQVLIRPLPVVEPARLVNLSAPGPKPGGGWAGMGGNADEIFSYPMFRDLQREQRVFTGIAAHQQFMANLAYDSRVSSAVGLLVSGSYFPVLGLQPALGRLLGPADDEKVGEGAVAVLSYGYWQANFGGRTNVLNQTIRVNGRPLTIVGVAPRGFDGTALGLKPPVFVPITMKTVVDRAAFAATPNFESRRELYWLNLFARLKPGISIDSARVSINTQYRRIINDVEAPLQLGMSPKTLARFRAKEILLEPGAQGRSMMRQPMTTPFILLLGITGLVLLIACANIANLLLARTAARGDEIALRVSLGATQRSIAAQLLTESCLLAACGGILGVLFAYWTLHLISVFLPEQLAQAFSLSLDGATLLFSLALTFVAALLAGFLPAMRSAQVDLLSKLKGQGGSLAGGHSGRMRASLIASQTAMAMILLVSAGLLIESLRNIGRVDLGLKIDNLVTFSLSPELNGYTPAQSQQLFERLEQQLAAMPGVSAVTASSVSILAGYSSGLTLAVQGVPQDPDEQVVANFNKVGAGYFGVLGIPLLIGREFIGSDTQGTGKVAVVNEHLAKKFNLGADVVGKWISSNGDEFDVQVVGLVRDAKYNTVKAEPPPQLFLPYRQDEALGALTFYVRAAMAPEAILSMSQKTVAQLDPNLPLMEAKTMARQVDDNIFLDRLVSLLCVVFAGLATLLAAVGIYGMLAFTVTQRTREIGLRMALGACRRAVAWPIVRNSLWLTGIGVAIGIAAALALTKLIRGLLFGVAPGDPTAIIIAALFLLAVAATAAGIPARRASKVDPMLALRAD